ncbi:MAG: hypothetical protein Q9206_002305 [Seirophora lacunosa]
MPLAERSRIAPSACPRSRLIHEKCQYVKCENECNNPFEDGSDGLVAGKAGSDEDGSEEYFDDDEEELHPEGGAEDAVLAEVDAEALIFSTYEDG